MVANKLCTLKHCLIGKLWFYVLYSLAESFLIKKQAKEVGSVIERGGLSLSNNLCSGYRIFPLPAAPAAFQIVNAKERDLSFCRSIFSSLFSP